MTIHLPVIDLLRADTIEGRQAIAGDIDAALHEHGFMAITGHRIDSRLIEALYVTMEMFFALPLDEKLATTPADRASVRGYRFVDATAHAHAHAHDEATEPVLVETFNAGPEPLPDTPYHRDAADFFAPNVWPPALPDLPALWRDYLRHASRLTDQIMRSVALALELDDNYFTPLMDKSMASMTVNRYPALDGELGDCQLRGGAHTDHSTITLLVTDGEPGLQLQDADGNWDYVAHVPGAIHVNTGDMLSTWSGGHWRSTWHRVAAPPGPPPYPARMTMAYHDSTNADTLISPLPGLDAAGYDDFEPIRAGTYLRDRLDRYHAARTGESAD